MTDLPNPSPDGRCCQCRLRPAVTTDRRFCLKCLRARLRQASPDPPRTHWRSADHRQHGETDPSPWGENAVRALEDGPPAGD